MTLPYRVSPITAKCFYIEGPGISGCYTEYYRFNDELSAQKIVNALNDAYEFGANDVRASIRKLLGIKEGKS